MHLDERLEKSREAIGKQLAVGQKKVSSAFNNLWAEMEAMREAQRKKQEEQRAKKEGEPPSPTGEKHSAALGGRCEFKIVYCSTLAYLCKVSKAPDLSHAQANIQAAGTRAGAYLSSWGAWASEKRKGWGARSASTTPITSPLPTEPTPGDIKRAEEFRKDKDYGSVPLSSARTAPPDVEAAASAAKRESVFFDAEKEKNKDVTKEAEHV